SPWSTLTVFEVILLSMHGKSGYDAYVNGKISKKKLQSVLKALKESKQYWPSDTSTISWTEANQKVMTGKAGFIVQGIWAAGAYHGNKKFNYEKDWGYVPFPGTEKYFDLNEDSFVYPKPNPSPKKTKEFLRYCGSKDGQARFSKNKGAIPCRSDVDMSSFPKFQQDTNKDFGKTTAIGSLTSGLQTSTQQLSQISTAMGNFVGNWNVDSSASAMLKPLQ
ncbi:MAG TPA: extracellular solute-binding protein, partial [Methanomicrobiales archaeon]|nr:extracellular solute-binding protein [Methanomicrobiales archaeon]